MNRRHFLNATIAAVSAFAIDPEQLLWTPKKTIFIPQIGYKMPYGVALYAAFGPPKLYHEITTELIIRGDLVSELFYITSMTS